MSPEYTRYTPKSERRVPRSSARKSSSRTPGRRGRAPRKKRSLPAQLLAFLGLVLVWPLRWLFTAGSVRKKVAVGACCVAGVLGVFLFVDWVSTGDDIHDGVRVYGIDVGGMPVREAALLINKAKCTKGTVDVTYQGESWTVPVADLKGRLDGRAAARQAYAYTRDADVVTRLWRRASLWVSEQTVDPPIKYDQAALKQAFDQIARDVEVKPVAATVKVNGAALKVKSATEGLAIDREALLAMFRRATIGAAVVKDELPVVVAEPAVSTEEARAAADQAREYLSGDLTLTHEGREFTLGRDELGQYLAFVETEGEPRFKATFASPITEGYFEYITSQIGKPGKDASFKIVGGGKRVKVVEGTIGYGVVLKKTVANMEAAAREEGDARVAEIVMGKAKPARNVDEATAMGITTRIATYTTGVAGTANRLENVRLGAELIDDTLIAPGDVFSVNGTTGERTAAAGFKMAPVIIAGKLEDAIGGGMCQVSTTVFNAAFGAGLEIVERHNHMLYISHYPLGRDATVNYGSYDLKFRNDTDHWILLNTTFSGWSLNVSLYSSPLKRKVTSTVGPQYNQTPHTIQRKDDPTLEKGKTKVETPGVDGWSLDCFRKVWENGKLIHNDVFKSVYSMVPEVVLVGTKAKPSPSPSPSGTTKPSPKPSPSGN